DEHAMTAAPRDVLKTGSELLGRGPPLVVVRGDDCRIDAFQIAHRCDYPLPWWSSSAGKLPRQPPGAVIQSATACVRLPHTPHPILVPATESAINHPGRRYGRIRLSR